MVLIGVLVTYRRPAELAETLKKVAEQTVQLSDLIVVDNDPEQSARAAASGWTYVSESENGGPAGGLAAGALAAVHIAGPDDWIVFLDDDDPPNSLDEFECLLTFAQSQPPDVGGVGKAGGRYSRRRGTPLRVPDSDLTGIVQVEWFGGGQFPLYRSQALSEAIPDASLFFGFDDLELGLRLRGCGWRLVVDGDRWLARRADLGRMRLSQTDLRTMSTTSDWRRYYVARNLLLISRRHGTRVDFFVATIIQLLRSAAAARYGLSAAVMSFRGLVDGMLGRAGRLVDPGY